MVKSSKRVPSAARIRSAAADGLTISAAETRLGYSGSLVEVFSKNAKLKLAWDAGRSCAKVSKLAEAGSPDSEIASAIGLTPQSFRAKVKRSLDLSEALDNGRVECRRRLREGLMTRAQKGEQKSLTEALAILNESGEVRPAGGGESFDPHRVKIEPVACESFGVSKVTIYKWKDQGCPGFIKGYLDFSKVYAWRIEHVKELVRQGKLGGGSSAGGFDKERTRKLKNHNDEREGLLLDATIVMADRVKLCHTFIRILTQQERLYPALFGDMDRQEIAVAITRDIGLARSRLVHEVAAAECLSPLYAAKYAEFIKAIFPLHTSTETEPIVDPDGDEETEAAK